MAPPPGLQLDGVDHGADRDVAQRQVVAGLDVGARAGLDPVALLQLVRRDDVALLAVGVVQQRDAGGAVRVVLDVSDLGRHAVLVGATEVDDAVGTLVTATLVAGGDPAGLLRPPFLCSGRTSDFSGVDRVTSTKSATLEPRRPGVVGLYLRIPMALSVLSGRSRSGDRASEDVDAVAGGDGDDRALGVLRAGRSRCGCACACPARLRVFTDVTFTPKTFSTAILIWVLFASGRTRNVYLFSSSSP